MAVEEILYGLKNAMDRGENLNDAAKSFINAGYDLNEVNEAMRRLGSTAAPQGMLPSLPAAGRPALQELPKKKEEMPIVLPELQPRQMPVLPPVKLPQIQQLPERPGPEFPTISSKPAPSKEIQELPQVEVKHRKFSLQNVSNRTLLISIGAVGLAIIMLTIYLVSLLVG